MAEEEDFSKLPFPERFGHKNWKVRKEAYEDASQAFEKTTDESDPFFREFLIDPTLWKGVAGDSNVAAQQEGLIALCAFLKYGGVEHATRTRGVTVGPISEKGLNSMRPIIKQSALEALLLYIEIDRSEPIIEALLPALSSKQPKVIAANLSALSQIYHAYGVKIVDPKPILKVLPKVFGHADKNVRAEASNLVVELYRWLREAIKPLFWNELKPVQQQDLERAFEPVKAEPHPKQERLLRSQQDAPVVTADVRQAQGEAVDDYQDDAPEMDAYDLAEPVDALAKAPKDLFEKLASTKWKDRKESLESLFDAANVPRIKDAPYDELMSALAKCMKDANIQVVMVAANNIEVFANGLRKGFAKYRSKVMGPMLERLKEKKQNVADALGAALDAVFQATSLTECLEEMIEALGPKNKNPQAKQETARLLVRCLRATKVSPSDAETKVIAETAKKLLTESTEAMRSVGAEILGTLMKIKTERKMTPYMEGLDDIRKTKIKEYFNLAEVKAMDKAKAAPTATRAAPGPTTRKAPMAAKKPSPAAASLKKPAQPMRLPSPPPEEAPSTPAAKPRMGLTKPGMKPGIAPPVGGLKLPNKSSGPPAGSPKRAFAPPREEKSIPESSSSAPPAAPRVGLGRGLAGRSLAKPNQAPSASPTRPVSTPAAPAIDRAELDESRAENSRLNALLDELRVNKAKLEADLSSLRTHEAELIEERTRSNLQLRAKDTQLVRAKSDAEVAKETAAKQAKEIERLKRELSRAVRTTSPPPAYVSPNPSEGAIFADTGLAGLDRYERDRASKEIGYQRARSYMSSPSEEKENASQDGASRVKRMTAAGSSSPSRRQVHSMISDGSASPMGRGSEMGDGPSGENGEGIHSWKRAAEVTSQLRARIEQMKARQGLNRNAS